MKRAFLLILWAILLVGMCACGAYESTPSWQEQYDLGIRYLSEGNYEEAIIAFTAAIEIDPKQSSTYVGRGDACIGSGETEKHLTTAQADYERAIELDATDVSAWLGLADVYIRLRDYVGAEDVLRQAPEKTESNQRIADKLAEFSSERITDAQGKDRITIWRLPDGSIDSYCITNYDTGNRRTGEVYCQADGTIENYNVITYMCM